MGTATSLHPLHAMCVGVFLSICQFDTHAHAETEKSRTHIHSHTQRSPAVNQRAVRCRKQTGYSVPWQKSLKLWPGCCRESTVCHTLQIQAPLCHTQITSLSLFLLCISLFLSATNPAFTSACTAPIHTHCTE